MAVSLWDDFEDHGILMVECEILIVEPSDFVQKSSREDIAVVLDNIRHPNDVSGNKK